MEMVRSARSHHEEEEDDEEEFVSRNTYGNSLKAKVDGDSSDQKVNTVRSKHSETEQRRRSKINERFQILRDLIPQNDQKRDKASFLLEVIQYVQFLQEKLQMYEGSYQSWSQEASKFTPWRNNCGPVESFIDQSQLIKNVSGQEETIVISPAMLSNAHTSLESDLSESNANKATDQSPAGVSQATPMNMPLQPNIYEDVATQPHQESLFNADHFASQSQSQFWQCRPCPTETAVPSYTSNVHEEPKIESGEASMSKAYSQGVLNSLTHALQSSGVDLSHASISVQLDIGKRAISGLNSTLFDAKDPDSSSPGNHAMVRYGVGSAVEDVDHVHKRLRKEQGNMV